MPAASIPGNPASDPPRDLATLIPKLLARLRVACYAGRDWEYYRDQRDLTKALARYGHECLDRGWEVDVDFIFTSLSGVIATVTQHWDRRRYLPTYLEGAVDRHVRMRAEEISARSRDVARLADTLTGRIRDQARRQAAALPPPRLCETLAALHRQLARRRRPAPPQAQQTELW